MKAYWNNVLLAESADTVTIEGNIYFPPNSLKREFFRESDTHTTCHWKGLANYYTIVVEGEINEDAAWYYEKPKDGSVQKVGSDFANYVAFWKGVEVR